MTTLLSPGVPLAMTQNIVYALPAKKVTVMADEDLEVAMTNGFTTFTTIASNTPTVAAGVFVRCTTSTTGTIVVKVD